jgi:hypothetical protein
MHLLFWLDMVCETYFKLAVIGIGASTMATDIFGSLAVTIVRIVSVMTTDAVEMKVKAMRKFFPFYIKIKINPLKQGHGLYNCN